jgi:protoporphyrinogen oxidase
MISRRKFLQIGQAVGLAALIPTVHSSCAGKSPVIQGKIIGANTALGHRLRTMDFGPARETIKTDILIVGGGVAGLSAARFLKKHTDNFLLLELGEEVGGNSLSGNNAVSKFPWGAHYLPIPGNNDLELIAFLRDENVITGVKNGLPVYNEYYLCHDPKERLFINNYWQEGIVPHEGVPKKDREEIQRFLELMHTYKELIGRDKKPAFNIPVDQSSNDPEITALDLHTAEEFLVAKRFNSTYLRWYVNYCCADDFGVSISQTSAWAMIHYFASRKGKAANAASDAVLTWPEGNAWLANALKKNLDNRIHRNSLVYEIKLDGPKVTCLYFDAARNHSVNIEADRVIIATPQYINKRILKNIDRDVDYTLFEYAPWMVANITCNLNLNEKRGETLCWDNVIYGSDALGYVNATHQQIGYAGDKNVITYYKPLLGDTTLAQRRAAHEKTFEQWVAEVVADLQNPHNNIEKHIEEMNVWIWGHGMIKPGKGFISGSNRIEANRPIGQRVFFAHSDLSGISIFEEAFYKGRKAAEAALNA